MFISQSEASLSDDQLSAYDVPIRLTAGVFEGDPWKMRQDAISSAHQNPGDSLYDKPSGMGFLSPNRASVLSTMSTGSSGMSDSTRSSVDASFATYDVLPNRCTTAPFDRSCDRQVANPNSLRGKSVEDQRDSYLEDYSVPRKGNDVVTEASSDPSSDLYDSPRNYRKQIVQEAEQDSEQLYDVPQFLTLEKVHAVMLKPFADLKLNPGIESVGQTLTEGDELNTNYDVPPSGKENQTCFVSTAKSLEKAKNLEDAINPIPESLFPVLKWQSDIQKHNSKLRSYILDCGDALSEDSGQQYNYPYPHIKLSCLSLKTATKELIDFCSTKVLSDNLFPLASSENLQFKKSFDKEKLKIRVEMLRTALRQFEDRSNELVSASPSHVGCQSKPGFDGKIKPPINQLKELVSVANVLPQIADLLLLDLYSQFCISISQVKPFDPMKQSVPMETYEGAIYAPLPPLQNKTFIGNESWHLSNDQRSVRNRPLPPTPPVAQLDKNRPSFPLSSTLPPQHKLNASNVHLGNQRLSNPISPGSSIQRLSCPGFTGSTNDAVTSSTLPARRSGSTLVSFHPLAAGSEINKRNTSELQCPLQKPHLPSQIHLNNVVNNFPPNSTKPSDQLSQLGLQSAPSDQQHPNPLLGSAESDALLVDFYASQVDGHMELVKKATADFSRIMMTFDPSDENRSNRHPHTPPRPIPSNHVFSNQRHQNPSNFQSLSQISTPQQNQTSPTPKEFVLRSKFVILAAHKLVYVADAIARNLADPSRYNDVAEAANDLCNVLKVAVNATKEAALSHDNHSKREFMNSSIAQVEVRSGELCRVISKHRRLIS